VLKRGPTRASLIVLLAMTPACEGDPGTGPVGPSLGSVSGNVALYDGLALEFHRAWPRWAIEPVPGPRLDALAFRVANGTALPRSFDPRNVRIETADGAWWPRIVAGSEAELHPMTLAPFEGANGWIVFRVPAAARPLAIVWTAAPGLALRIPLPAHGKDAG
jgi:hypothetical protein